MNGCLLVKKNDTVFFGDGLEKAEGIKKVDRLKNIGRYLRRGSMLEVEDALTFAEAAYLRIKNKEFGIKIKAVKSPVDFLRIIKEPAETKNIAQAMQIVRRVFGQVKKVMRQRTWTEIALANFIKSTGLKLGAEDVSFPPIVASGANAAIPHHVPSNKKLKAGESIIIDFGFKFRGYCSDFTRTIFLKRVPERLAKAYNQVEKAYNEAIAFLSSSGKRSETRGSKSRSRVIKMDSRFRGNDKKIIAGHVYQKSLEVLAEKNLDKYFIHNLGHGTGLEIHELPNLSPDSKDILREGMVFSIEPGVYIPKVGGIRIEDLIYLEGNQAKKFVFVPTSLADNIITIPN